MIRRVLPLLLVAFSASASPHPQDVAISVRVLAGAEPRGLTWRYSQHLDLNCDGARDEIFTAEDHERFYVGVVLGPISAGSHCSIAMFGLGGDHQDSFCGTFESIEPQSLTSVTELVEMLGDVPLGYRYSPTCHGLRIVAGECDSFHLFWNHMSSSLDWWRL